ncbi:MAG: AraC family transcriptional regulator [Oceanipulchritudo sp.]
METEALQNQTLIGEIHALATQIEPPRNFFHGLKLRESFSPDNILLFCHKSKRDFHPEGVTNNYHHRHVLVFVVKNGGPGRIGDHTHLLEEGNAVLIFPNQFHHFMDLEGQDLEWLFITFELPYNDPIRGLRDTPRLLDQETYIQLKKVLEVHRGLAKGELLSVSTLSDLVTDILFRMLVLPVIPEERRNIHFTDATRDVLLEKINTIVRENLHRQLTVADLAAEMGYSVSYLRTIFRNRLGISLGRYIRESRLSRAAELLQTEDMSISEIAEKCGFESLCAFSRSFKNAYGMSPKVYGEMVAD